MSQRHDLVAIRISDEAEAKLPDAGLLVLRDPETGELTGVNTSSAETRELYDELIARERSAIRRVFRRVGVDEVEVRTGASYVAPLLSFFRRRERQGRR